MSEPREGNLGKHSRVTLGVMVAVLIFTVGSAVGGALEWASLKSDVRQIAHDQWTVTEQLRWTSEFQKLNPQLNVPIPTTQMAVVSQTTNAVLAAAAK